MHPHDQWLEVVKKSVTAFCDFSKLKTIAPEPETKPNCSDTGSPQLQLCTITQFLSKIARVAPRSDE